MSEPADAPKQRRKREGGLYFTVPLAHAEAALKLGLEPALAFLALARGSGGCGRTTSWSANAMEKRGILGRHPARRAIRALEDADLCSPPAPKTISRRKIAPRPPIPDAASGGPPAHVPMAWLPNVLVDGLAGRKPPLARLREARSPDALRLLLLIYAACDLVGHAGVPVQDLRMDWPLVSLGDRGAHRIYGVGPGKPLAGTTGKTSALAKSFLTGETETVGGAKWDVGWDAFFRALALLEDMQLLRPADYVFDAAAGEGHPIFPFNRGEEAEAAFAAKRAAAASAALIRPLRGAGRKGDASKGHDLVIAVPRHITPHAIGIYRPRYIAQTEPNLRWLQQIGQRLQEIDDLP